MRFAYAYQTDIGTVRTSNQDSLLVKSVSSETRSALLAAVCDGVGGMKQGEITSRRAAEMLASWADFELLQIMEKESMEQILRHRFRQLIQEINREIYCSNRRGGISSGTTLSAILLWDYRYLTCHVGDSRIYRIDHQVRQLTKDHSWVAQEVAAGRMTQEEARYDSRQNLILKCIGAEAELEPEMAEGEITEPAVFLLCTDGFWHNITDEEWIHCFSPQEAAVKEVMGESVYHLIGKVKQRGETDNITAVAVHVC